MNCRVIYPASRRPHAGFTMVEIAIALGVIGFALVAIIGILPTGLEVQRDNRSETIINQDAQLWMEAIRSGTSEVEGLLERVEQIELRVGTNPPVATYTLGNGARQYGNVSNVIGLLTWAAANEINRVAEARVTAISGAASEKEMNQSKRADGVGFSYLLRVSIERVDENTAIVRTNAALPFIAVEKAEDPAVAVPLQTEEYFGYPSASSLYEIRLTFLYPFVSPNKLPPRTQVFRSTVARSVHNEPPGSDQFFFRP